VSTDPATALRFSEKEAARLLVTATAFGTFNLKEAQRVIPYLRPKRINSGTTFLREGDRDADYLVWILSGDVRAECRLGNSPDKQTLHVFGPGNVVGEVSMFLGGPCSADCVAITDVAVAVLSRAAFEKMMEEDPVLASRLLLAVTCKMADRISSTFVKLKRFAQLNETLYKEVYLLMDAQPIGRPRPALTDVLKSGAFAPTDPVNIDGLAEQESPAPH